MKPKKKLMISAATLAVLASSVSGACGAQQATSSDQQVTDPVEGTQTVVTAPVVSSAVASTSYADGTYTGSASPTRWGDVQVSVVIENGAIADVEFLTYPDGDRKSAEINAQANGMLIQEAIEAQSAQVQVISGATFTSLAFMESLESALAQAT